MLCRKVKTILVIMGICCFPMISWAQVFLSGRIVDKKTNEPVVGASVYIQKLLQQVHLSFYLRFDQKEKLVPKIS